MTIKAHPHQERMLAEAREAFKSHNAVLIQSPTGSGKTVIGTLISQGAYERKRRVMFTVHRDFLIDQTSEAFRKVGLPHGIIAAGVTGELNTRVQVASIDTLKHRLDRVARPDLLIIDECHHALAAGWLKVIREFMDKGTKVCGLTATPWRLSGEGLGRVFQHMVQGPSVRWLIDNGYLCEYTAYAPAAPDLSAVKSRHGDFIKSEVELAVDKPTITGDAIAHYQRISPGKRAVAFCVSIAHSQHVAATFNASGIPAAHMDSNTPKAERLRTINAFRRGAIMVLTSVDIFGEGFDLPAVETVLLLRPTQSLALHLQQIGRGLRTSPGKDRAFILDHAGNLMRLGLPDAEFEWSLSDLDRKKKGAAGVPTKTCVYCFGVFAPAPVCPYCGKEQPVQERAIEHVDGELQEITPEMRKNMAVKKRQEVGMADSLDAIKAIAKERGYSPKWAEHVWAARQRAATAKADAQFKAFARP